MVFLARAFDCASGIPKCAGFWWGCPPGVLFFAFVAQGATVPRLACVSAHGLAANLATGVGVGLLRSCSCSGAAAGAAPCNWPMCGTSLEFCQAVLSPAAFAGWASCLRF
mmetsp:Transcript_85593/g.229022  ORF Transcript_85593/g.229022 Transcript_85593/m.229022 type:complete len:110 (+) Transcript_85593:235-564(+)